MCSTMVVRSKGRGDVDTSYVHRVERLYAAEKKANYGGFSPLSVRRRIKGGSLRSREPVVNL